MPLGAERLDDATDPFALREEEDVQEVAERRRVAIDDRCRELTCGDAARPVDAVGNED